MVLKGIRWSYMDGVGKAFQAEKAASKYKEGSQREKKARNVVSVRGSILGESRFSGSGLHI